MIKVSIVVPVYNVEKYVAQCLDSLINQTLKDIEIIVVSDASPDGSIAICRSYAEKDHRVRIVEKEKNEGLGLTRNVGIEESCGEYIAFCDSDDYVSPDTYEKMYCFAKANQLDVCYCNYVLDNNGIINTKTGSPTEQFLYLGKANVRGFLLDMIGPQPDYPSDVKYMISSCMAMYRGEIIRNHNVRFMCERVVLSEDTIFNTDFLAHANNVGYMPDQLYFYRYNPSSLSRTFNHKKAETFITLLSEVKGRLERYFSYDEYKLHYQRFVFYIFRLLIKYEAILNIDGERRKYVRMRCEHPLLTDVYKEYPYSKFPIPKRLFFYCMKHKLVSALILMSIIENNKRKNI